MSQREPILFSEVPGLRSLPFLPLASGTTAIDPVPGFGGKVFMKRDDRIAPLYGGNKIRRFELLLAKALDEGARTVLTVGGLASTQVTATVLYGRSVGLDVTAVLFDQPKTDFMRESMGIDLRAGGKLVHGGSYARTAARFFAERRQAFKPFVILPGASSPLCNLGYVDAMFELAGQVERGEMPRPDRIVVACGSGGTVAGLTVGASWLGWPTTVVGARITELIATNRVTMTGLIEGTARFIARRGGPSRSRLTRGRFEIDHRVIGKGYGYTTDEAERGAEKITELIGAPGEITYSGKAYAALERQVADHPDENILFWCTLSSLGRTPDRLSSPEGTPREIANLFDG